MARYYIRCRDCLAVGAVDVEGPPQQYASPVPKGLCTCGGHIECMGRVSRDGRLKHDALESVCDDRCTNARGPSCNCHCGGKNHGSKAVVAVEHDAGALPRFMLVPDRGRALEYRVARREAELRVHALNGDDLLARKLRGAYLNSDDFARYRRIGKGHEAIRATARMRTHAGRLKALRAIEPTVEPAAWDVFEDEAEGETATA